MRFDYQEFRVSGEEREHLRKALQLALGLHGDDARIYGMVTKVLADEQDQSWGCTGRIPHPCLLLSTHHGEPGSLPAPVDGDGALPIIWSWLQGVVYPPQPDHDGSNEKGWRVRFDGGSVWAEGVIIVEPAWAIYGK